jgi:hypothetical protein
MNNHSINFERQLLSHILSLSSQLQVCTERQEQMTKVVESQNRSLVCIEKCPVLLTINKIRRAVFQAHEHFYFKHSGLKRQGDGVVANDLLLQELKTCFQASMVNSKVSSWLS